MKYIMYVLHTIFFVHKGSLRRFRDTFPDCDWFGIARIHGLHFFTVSPIPKKDNKEKKKTKKCIGKEIMYTQ